MSEVNHKDSTSGDDVVANSSKLCKDIASLYLKQKFSDIALIVDGQKLYANKAILAVRSEYFEALLYGGLQESSQGEITITDSASPRAFRALLKYIYTDNIAVVSSNVELALQVLELAHKYCIKDLEDTIIEKLKLVMDINNVSLILNAAHLYGFAELKDACHLILQEKASDFLTGENFTKLSQEAIVELFQKDVFFADEIEIFRAAIKWRETNIDVGDALLKCVRLSWLTADEIITVVWPTGFINSDLLLSAIAEVLNLRPRTVACRARFVLDVNVASADQKAEVLSSTGTSAILNGNTSRGIYECHSIDDSNGIVIKLGVPSIVNHIRLLLYDENKQCYSYYVECSTDSNDWKRLVDHTDFSCRSRQNLYFQNQAVLYFRVVGTFNSEISTEFRLVAFEASCKSVIPPMFAGFVQAVSNVATPDEGAAVIEGQKPLNLLNGNIKDYDGGNGYTFHYISEPEKIIIQLAQPYLISSMKMLLWDIEPQRIYKYHVETSVDKLNWEMAVDRNNQDCQSWQLMNFNERLVVFIRIVGTHNSVNSGFHCVHFECPASSDDSKQH